jgi:NADPH:quinone reductase
VNFIEVYQRTGLYQLALPFTPGSEAGGTVEAVGEGVTAVKTGQRVASQSFAGAYAEFAVAPEDRLIVLPPGVTTRIGAAVMLQGMTAHYLACSTYPLSPDDTCLVHAAAGGVGLLLCQIARRRGARVIGTVSTEEKAELARRAGASDVILYTRQDFVAETRRLTGGAGVQVVFDSVGKTTFLKGFDCLAPRGMMVLYGQSSGPVDPFDPQMLNQKGSLFLTRPTIQHYIGTRTELLQRANALLGWIEDGSLDVSIGREFPLTAAAEAHRELEARRTTGKLLLLP